MQFQVDNLSKDLQYDAKLFQATIDGMQAFELNTVNNRFSQVADSLKRDVEAGIFTFINSLASSVGYSGINNQFLLPYLPAVLFTLYDGYYIYAPTYTDTLSEIPVDEKDIDGFDITVKKDADTGENVYEHMLKPYIYYTTRYISGNSQIPSTYYDFVVNYTLDNYITIYGTVKGEYVTRSGFLCDPNNIEVEIDVNRFTAILARKILEYVEVPRYLDNKTETEIWNRYKEYSNNYTDENLKDKLLSVLRESNGESKIAEVALKNTIGEYLYNKMLFNNGDIETTNAKTRIKNGRQRVSNSLSGEVNYDNNDFKELLEAISDSLINEKFSIDRNVVTEIIARETFVKGGYLTEDVVNGLTQAEAISIFTGKYKNNETYSETYNNTLKGVSDKFINIIKSWDDLINDLKTPRFSNEDEASITSRVNEFKLNISQSIGIPLLQEILKNDKKDLSGVDDDYLFSLIDGRNIFHNTPNYEVMVDMIRDDSNSSANSVDNYVDEVIDAFTVIYDGQEINESDAKRYYVKSLRFTYWVNDNLNSITETHAVKEKLEDDDNLIPLFQYSNSTKPIFKTDYKVLDNYKNDPEEEDSDFNQHRMKCIQASIQTNLNTAIAQYNQDFFQKNKDNYSLTMPVISYDEWYKITSNIAMVSFFQGMRVGNKIYNDYAVVTSNKNKQTINTDHIYYIDDGATGITYYHRADCPHLTNVGNIIGLKNIDYDIYKDEDKNKDMNYSFSDELNERIANTKITNVYACYYCIVDRNYTAETTLSDKRKNAIYTAIAREKNNLYKVNDYFNDDIMTDFIAR